MRQLSLGIIRGTMRRSIGSIMRPSALALLFSALPWLASQAQTSAASNVADQTKTAGPFSYDASQEVTLNGTISSVLAKASPGMIPGAHLLLTTVDGAMDISLGTAVRQGAGALSITAGQQVEVVGIMKTIKQKQVFLARSVQAGSHLYVIRNQHGIPVSPIGRERMIQNAGHDGDTL